MERTWRKMRRATGSWPSPIRWKRAACGRGRSTAVRRTRITGRCWSVAVASASKRAEISLISLRVWPIQPGLVRGRRPRPLRSGAPYAPDAHQARQRDHPERGAHAGCPQWHDERRPYPRQQQDRAQLEDDLRAATDNVEGDGHIAIPSLLLTCDARVAARRAARTTRSIPGHKFRVPARPSRASPYGCRQRSPCVGRSAVTKNVTNVTRSSLSSGDPGRLALCNPSNRAADRSNSAGR